MEDKNGNWLEARIGPACAPVLKNCLLSISQSRERGKYDSSERDFRYMEKRIKMIFLRLLSMDNDPIIERDKGEEKVREREENEKREKEKEKGEEREKEKGEERDDEKKKGNEDGSLESSSSKSIHLKRKYSDIDSSVPPIAVRTFGNDENSSEIDADTNLVEPSNKELGAQKSELDARKNEIDANINLSKPSPSAQPLHRWTDGTFSRSVLRNVLRQSLSDVADDFSMTKIAELGKRDVHQPLIKLYHIMLRHITSHLDTVIWYVTYFICIFWIFILMFFCTAKFC